MKLFWLISSTVFAQQPPLVAADDGLYKPSNDPSKNGFYVGAASSSLNNAVDQEVKIVDAGNTNASISSAVATKTNMDKSLMSSKKKTASQSLETTKFSANSSTTGTQQSSTTEPLGNRRFVKSDGNYPFMNLVFASSILSLLV